jgi:hypothetical protein
MDKKPVYLINSISLPTKSATVTRTAKDGSKHQIPCPKSVQLYNKYMGGVDLFDFRRKTYSCSRKSKKWWLRLFYFLLGMATTNAYIIYKESQVPGSKPTAQNDIILGVASRLTLTYSSRMCSTPQQTPSSIRLIGRHFPDKQEQAYCCKICPERKRTIFYCCNCCQDNSWGCMIQK